MKSRLLGVLCAVVFSFITLPSHAALISVLGGQAYYDDVADLTWLADANAAGTAMNWAEANTWAAGLNIGGVTGWRLPDTLQPDSSCSNQSNEYSFGYYCTGSEMGNLWYNVLGGTGGVLIAESHNSNYELFSNIQSSIGSDRYWSATEHVPDTHALMFQFSGGSQFAQRKDLSDNAWAVHSGDVSVVPVPAAVWLFGSGLLGLIGIAKKRNAT